VAVVDLTVVDLTVVLANVGARDAVLLWQPVEVVANVGATEEYTVLLWQLVEVVANVGATEG
jgi:hypothetical protein